MKTNNSLKPYKKVLMLVLALLLSLMLAAGAAASTLEPAAVQTEAGENCTTDTEKHPQANPDSTSAANAKPASEDNGDAQENSAKNHAETQSEQKETPEEETKVGEGEPTAADAAGTPQNGEEAETTEKAAPGEQESKAEKGAGSAAAPAAGEEKKEASGSKDKRKQTADEKDRKEEKDQNGTASSDTTDKQETKTKASVKEKKMQEAFVRLQEVDNATSLPDGEYTDFTYDFEGGTGKAKLTLEKITVTDGKAVGTFTASSTSMTHVYYLGHTSSQDDSDAYYNPSNDKCGEGVLPIANKSVEFPVALNQQTEIACRTVAMTVPHWVQYQYTITIEETVEDPGVDNTTVLDDGEYTVPESDFTWEGGTGKAKLLLDKVVVKNGRATGVFTASSTSMTHVYYLGHTESNDEDPRYYNPSTGFLLDGVKVIADKAVEFPVVLNKAQDIACRTVAMTEPHWVQYTYTISLDESQSTPKEKESYQITFQVTDETTGKEITKATVTVKDAKGNTVKADNGNVYTLTEGTRYSITAKADKYEESEISSYIPKKAETVKIELSPEEVLPEGTLVFEEGTKTPVINTTGMFKVLKGVLKNVNGQRTLTVTLSGSGYHYLYKGTYEEALANGLNKKNWIAGKQNKKGKWEFTIPLDKGETYLPIVAISDTHLKKVEKGQEELGDAIFARQIVLDLKKNTLTAGDYDEVATITVISKTETFKAAAKGTMEIIGGPNSNNYSCIPVITMQDGRYTKAFIGTAADAAKAGAKVIKKNNGSFTFAFVNSFGGSGRIVTFEDKKPIAVAFYDKTQKKWVDYKLTIDKSKKTVTIEALGKDEKPPEKPKQETYSDSSDKGTSAVDSNTTLKDGVYSPKSFRFSGGTGKVIITCTKVEVKGGQAYATIHFGKPDGREASVDSLRANGQTYSGFNTFTIPVKLNANNTIVGRTTAMSQPHWIEYTIFIVLDEPGKESSGGKDVSEQTTELDADAPEIIGLTAVGEVETPYSDLLKIFEYEDQYYLIEVDAVKDTARDTLEYRTEMEAAALKEAKEETTSGKKSGPQEETGQDRASESAAAEAVTDGATEGEGSVAESISEMIAKLYENEIIKYLIIPADKEVPAGLDKEVLIIKQPADRAYISSETALTLLCELGAAYNITTIGLDVKDLKDAVVQEALLKKEGAVRDGGSYDKWDLKTMILEKTNFAIESEKILPRDEAALTEDMENLVRLGERAAQMEMAMFIDRSADEQNALAEAEWYKVYGILYGLQNKADQLYKEVVSKASEKEKTDAAALLKMRAAEKEKLVKEARAQAEKTQK